ncbi:hypothetical protein EDB81DRAFT_929624 [Dactylonectria macrodidyma]|uniref:Zn(2)-C6 fungal-type domain-containing protein n=1 Tax=Dactylonectria macrodidyma TaxID=307937 RepID=A0A9P9I6G0_9HYPO|nr:hypothetical protein EDB81DRAFT_929624 [Dactylonectria macrodidyma]
MDQEHHLIDSAGSPKPRRILRKGTHSCAECKRRKVRCFFDNSTDAVCVGCQRRGTPCIGQEFIDIPGPNHGEDERIVAGLNRVERMLEKITRKFFSDFTGTQQNKSISQPFLPRQAAEAQTVWQDGQDSADDEGHDLVNGDITGAAEVAARDAVAKVNASDFILSKHLDTCRALHAAFPSQQDVDTLLGTGRATIFLQALCNPYNELFTDGNVLSSTILSVLPDVTAHPVVLARKLLQLSLAIQQLDSSFDRSVLRLPLGPRDAMERYVNLASSMVTCHDDLLDSLEGLECLIYEGVYLVNCGNLRRALLCLRRACTLAQFMGVHRKSTYVAIKKHDPATRVTAEFTWAHIVFLERYLSLLLGMPTSITGVRFASGDKTEGETWTQWLEKVQIDMFEHIISRNQSGDFDFAVTQKIDLDLNNIANTIPTHWWIPMKVHQRMTEIEIMAEVISGQSQIIHYNLLTLLHLPFLLRNPTDHRFDSSKTTCTYASREVLTRFITFRSIVTVVFCCRFVDFCAFTAALTLLLSHLNRHGQNSGWMPTHQRLGDRALIERTVETLDDLNRLNNDHLSMETAKLTRKLLNLEAESAKGGQAYSCTVVQEDQIHDMEERNHHFYLKIPYFGVLKLLESSHVALTLPLDAPSTMLAQLQQHPLAEDEQRPSTHDPITQGENEQQGLFDLHMPDIMADIDEWAFQGVDTAFFDSLMSGVAANQGGWDGHW